MSVKRSLTVALALLLPVAANGQADNGTLVLQGGKHSIAFNPTNGSIVHVSDGDSERSLFRSGERGLWKVRLRDGKTLNAAEFQAGAPTKSTSNTRGSLWPKSTRRWLTTTTTRRRWTRKSKVT